MAPWSSTENQASARPVSWQPRSRAAAQPQAEDVGFTVLHLAGSESAAEVPFQGLHRLLTRLLDRAARLPAAQHLALMTALGLRQEPAPESFLVALAEAAAQGPVLVCVDDLQWLDQSGAGALAVVARRLGYDPIVLPATSRTLAEERPAPADLTRVDPGPLSEADARGLVRRARADLDPTACGHILTRAEGNPLALVELSKGWSPDPVAYLSEPGERGDVLTVTARLERAFVGRLELAYGGWPRRRRQGTDSHGPLREALAVFEAIGARPWADLAGERLRAAGHRAPTRQGNVLAQLSPQELRPRRQRPDPAHRSVPTAVRLPGR
ncbi:hypothetical protein ACIPSA_19205 [Streptomyces sp. NPDC086549]|uniref:hypothetical protein n=1 Tax=Streptomyces sp. NPDC086549 TaxID=3365752 RepID=UPI0038194262